MKEQSTKRLLCAFSIINGVRKDYPANVPPAATQQTGGTRG